MISSESKKNLIQEIETLRSPRGYLYAGVPKFQGLFGRDSLIAAWQLLKFDPDIAINTISALADVQGKRFNEKTGEEPGKIPHEFYPEETADEWFNDYKKGGWLEKGVPNYFSIDATPLFVIVLAKTYWQTQDLNFLAEKWPNLIAAIGWICDYLDRKGTIAHDVMSPDRGLESQSWKDGIGEPVRRANGSLAVVEVQGYSYAALAETAKLARIIGKPGYANRLEKRARKLKRRFNQTFWHKEEKFFFFGIDSTGQQIKPVTSNPGHLLFTGIIEKGKADYVVKRLFSPDLWTKYGIRTHSKNDPDFNPCAYQLGSVWPHDNWIIAEGMKTLGYLDEYRRIIEAMLLAYREINHVPELYGVSLDEKLFLNELEEPPCYPQAWSTAALLNFVTD